MPSWCLQVSGWGCGCLLALLAFDPPADDVAQTDAAKFKKAITRRGGGLFHLSADKEDKTMEASSNSPKVWMNGRLQDVDRNDAALTSLCQAVERAVRAHQAAGVRAVILMVDPPTARLHAEPVTPMPVYVDVFDSGFGHDSGYGHGI